jgi:hypothetical protein
MRIWVFGSRSFGQIPPEDKKHALYTACTAKIREVVAKLPDNAVIVHGACPRSPDVWFANAAQARGLAQETYPANWNKHGRRAGMIRNEEMAATQPDLALGFWDVLSKGTGHSILMCNTYDINHLIYRFQWRNNTVVQTKARG